MSCKVFLAATLSLFLISLDVLALGLGWLRTESALNQPFLGEIDLLDVSPDDLDTIRAALANADAFAKSGIERYHFLTRLAFDPQMSARGAPVIRVTSHEPIREPFVDFLMEVVWSSGKVVKEYTVLLDPPGTADGRAPEVGPPGIADRRPAAPEAKRPNREAGQAPALNKAPAERMPSAAGSVEAGSDAFPMQFGPVRPAEGIWRVARNARPDGATPAQTALALYRNNQEAFIGGDINRLRVGKALIIPTRAELFALDAAEADREFRAALQGEAIRRSPITDITLAESAADAPLRIAGVAAGAAALAGDMIQAESMAAGESARQETEELRGRVQQLETQLNDLQALLQLRNEELARLQGIARPETIVEAIGDPIEQPLLDTDSLVESQVGVVDADAVAEVEASATDGMRPVNGAAPDPISDIDPTPVDPDTLVPTAVLQEAQPPLAEPESQPQPAAGSTWHSFLLPLAGFAAVTALGVLAISWMALRRRRREKWDDGDIVTSDLPSLDELTPGPPISAQPATELRMAAGPEDDESAAQRSGLSWPGLASQPDRGISAASSPNSVPAQLDAETDEADAISEADIYIAYGRYKEAEELLKRESERSPERHDVRFKLAEVHAAPASSIQDDLPFLLRDAALINKLELPLDVPEQTDRGPGRVTEPGSSSGSTGVGELFLMLDDLSDSSVLDLDAFAEPDSWTDPAKMQAADRDVPSLSLPEDPLGDGPGAPSGPASSGVGAEISEGAPFPAWPMDSGVWDENATKLDLARAYIDMGDALSARAILDEVLVGGREELRLEAQALLRTLD